jgi:hypothetical protein
MYVAIVIVPLVTIVLWLFVIRPYCRRNGKGYTPGANIGVTYWVDWQEATEISKNKGDGAMIMICRLVLWLHILGFAILACAVLNSFQ